jgi:hypothetical protein
VAEPPVAEGLATPVADGRACEAVTVTLSVPLALSEGLREPLWVKLGVTEAEGDGDAERECEGEEEPEGEGVPLAPLALAEPEKEAEGVLETLAVGDTELLCVVRATLTVALAVREMEGDCEGDPLPVGERDALRDIEAQDVAEEDTVLEADTEAVFDTDAERVLVPEKNPLTDALRDTLTVAHGDAVRDAQVEALVHAVPVRDGEALCESLPDNEGEGVEDRVASLARSDEETEGLCDALTERHAQGVAVWLAEKLPLPVSDRETVALPDEEMQTLTEGVYVGVTEGAREPLGEPLTERDPEVEGLTESEGDVRAEADAERDTEGEDVTENETLTLPVTDGLKDGVTLPEKDAVSEGEIDIEGVTVGETEPRLEALGHGVVVVDKRTVAEDVTLLDKGGELDAEGQRDADPVPVTVWLGEALPKCAPEGDTDSVGETLAEVHTVGEPDSEEDALGDFDTERVKDGLMLTHCVGDSVPVALAQLLTEFVRAAVPDSDGEGLTLRLTLGEGERDGLCVFVCVTEGLPPREEVTLPLGVAVAESHIVGICETRALRENEPETVAHTEALGESEAEPDCLGDAVALGEPDKEPEAQALRDFENVAVGLAESLRAAVAVPPVAVAVSPGCEGEALALVVPLCGAEGVGGAVSLMEPQNVVECVALREVETEGVGECDPDTDSDGVWQPLPVPLAAAVEVARADAVKLLLPLPHRVGLPVSDEKTVALEELDSAAEPLPQSLLLRDTLGEALNEAAPEALTERDVEALLLCEAVAQRDGDGVKEDDAETHALWVAVAAGDAVAEGEATEGVAQSE